ncbi:hypothetical protein [Dermabacter hominis]|uniref:hypothetical protein n=1 Tax=Dermabacter hominis TaxID=36740 RepID=UPI0024331A71|nr:hypothetical protein [Dermabacter hominis]
MTLTLETAKHIINSHGEVFAIVETRNGSTDTVMTREQAETIAAYNPNFKPCVVVTTAREALEAAWELAHVPEGRIIPANSTLLRRDRENGRIFMSRAGADVEATNNHSERRLIDPPTPEPEPWELARYCHANGDFYERFQDSWGAYWKRPAETLFYRRKDLAKLNPKPVTIEGEAE